MKKNKGILILFAFISGGVFFFCLLCVLIGSVARTYNGFAVDSNGKIYIGSGHRIKIYEDQQIIGEITTGTSRGFAFTIQGNDTILLSTSTVVYIMTLDGKIIDQYDDTDTSIYNRYQKNKEFRTSDGILYRAYNTWGRMKIYKEDVVIYQAPIEDFAVKLVMPVSMACFFLCVAFIIPEGLKTGTR